jgi:hypothetical protein
VYWNQPKVEVIQLSREDLYEKVGSEPTRTLALKYGLSDVGLAKICKNFKFPRPGLGFWAKKGHGKKVRKTPLPAIRRPYCEETVGTDDFGRQVILGKEYLDIRVSKSSTRRSLLLMDSILGAFKIRGFEVRISKDRDSKFETHVIVHGQEIQFALDEKLSRQEKPMGPRLLQYRPRGNVTNPLPQVYRKFILGRHPRGERSPKSGATIFRADWGNPHARHQSADYRRG